MVQLQGTPPARSTEALPEGFPLALGRAWERIEPLVFLPQALHRRTCNSANFATIPFQRAKGPPHTSLSNLRPKCSGS